MGSLYWLIRNEIVMLTEGTGERRERWLALFALAIFIAVLIVAIGLGPSLFRSVFG